MQEVDSIVGEVDRHLAIVVRLWRWDRIGGRRSACRRDLIELDQLLDERLARSPRHQPPGQQPSEQQAAAGNPQPCPDGATSDVPIAHPIAPAAA